MTAYEIEKLGEALIPWVIGLAILSFAALLLCVTAGLIGGLICTGI